MSGVITINDNGGLVYKGKYCRSTIETIKTVQGRQYNSVDKTWSLPANEDVLNTFQGSMTVTITPEARALIQAKMDAVNMIKQVKHADDVQPLKDMPINVVPFKHQIQAFNIGVTTKSVGLLHEQGCGKTISAIAIAGRRYLDQEIKRVLIVAPLSVLPVWQREFRERAVFDCDVRAMIGVRKKKLQAIERMNPNALQVILINYESVWRPGIYDRIKEWEADMIIVDESQKIKGVSTNQSKALHKLGESCNYTIEYIGAEEYITKNQPYKMILTGTPITATPLDFWSQYRFLDPDIFGKSYYSFRNRYAVMGGYQNKQIVGFRNKEELIRRAHSIAHRVTKAEALDLPDQIDQELYCELEPGARKAYNQLVKESVVTLESLNSEKERTLIADHVLTRLIRLQQLIGGFVPDEMTGEMMQVSRAKLDLLEETLVDMVGAGHKVVIFARFVAEIQAILDMLKRLGIHHSYIYGQVKHKDRGDMVSEFQDNPDCKVFLAQVQTAGLGITLHAADVAVFYSADFNYANYEQCKARIHRIGQRHVVNYIHLIIKSTVDEKIYQTIKRKESVAQDIIDNWRAYLHIDE